MSVSYDFDIHWILPQELMADPAIAKMMGDIGFKTDTRANYVALFRDPRTVEILRGADTVVQEWLKASGFGFNVYDSGVGPGRYPAKDEAARNDVIARLSDNMKSFKLKGANLNGFAFGEFLKAVVEAKPVAGDPAQPAPQPAAPAPRRADAATQRPGPRAVPDIDAAFANPKAGARLPERDGREPNIEDFMDAAASLQPPVGPDGLPFDDLKYRPTTPREHKARMGVPTMPMIMVGAVMFFFMIFMIAGGQTGGELVAR